jgi:hypothetical protein
MYKVGDVVIVTKEGVINHSWKLNDVLEIVELKHFPIEGFCFKGRLISGKGELWGPWVNSACVKPLSIQSLEIPLEELL